jgi:hypothetical protein
MEKPTVISRNQDRQWERELRQLSAVFAAELKRRFEEQIARDARGFKKTLLSTLKRMLPPGPGRLPVAAITKAIQMRKLGRTWKDIYPATIPNYSELGRAERHLAESNLRAACRSRVNATVENKPVPERSDLPRSRCRPSDRTRARIALNVDKGRHSFRRRLQTNLPTHLKAG